jgi:pyruvate formate lyase activating enzyme
MVEELGPEVPWHFSAFHPDYRMRGVPATPVDTLRRARDIARSHGLHYIYTGNVHDEVGGSTWCHACGEKLIGRDWYVLSDWNLDGNGHCRSCGSVCAGVFEASPGTWGSRRLPVRLADF